MGVYDTFQSADYEIEDAATLDVYSLFTPAGRKRVSGGGGTSAPGGDSGGSGGSGGSGSGDYTFTFLNSLPSSATGLYPGDLYWNGDALFRNGPGSGGGGGISTGGLTVSAFLDSLLLSLPTETPTASGVWWNNNGTFARTA